MNIKIIFGRLSAGQIRPTFETTEEVNTPLEAMTAFKNFFIKNPDLPTVIEVDKIIQSEGPLTVSGLSSIKYYLEEAGYTIRWFAMAEGADSILDDLTRTSGVVLLNNNQKLLGFIPRGFYLRFGSELDAEPYKIYSWVNKQVSLFPSSLNSDPFAEGLEQLRENKKILGFGSPAVAGRLSEILSKFDYELVII